MSDANNLSRRKLLTKGAILGASTAAGVGATTGLARPALSQNLEEWEVLTAFSSTGILGRAIQSFCEQVTARTNGRLTFTIYPAGEKEQPFDILDAVGKNRAAMGYGAPYYWALMDPAFSFIASMPFGLTAMETNAWLFEDEGLDVANTLYNQFGCFFLPLGNTGNQMGGWFRKEVNTVDDLKGLRMRMPGLGGEVLKSLGVKTEFIAPSEIIPAMSRDELDATEWIGPAADLEMQLYRHASIYYGPGWHEPATVLDLSINLERWTGLSGDERALFQQLSRQINSEVLTTFYASNARALEVLVQEHNVETREFSEELMMALGQRTGELLFDLAKDNANARQVFVSLADFRRSVKRFGEVSEGAYLRARGLPFVFPG